jgi:hypothetical protein
MAQEQASGSSKFHEMLFKNKATSHEDLLRAFAVARESYKYGVEQAYGLYPTSGASDDHAFSRHFADPLRA